MINIAIYQKTSNLCLLDIKGAGEIKHFSENARLSVLRYQSEEANDKWNQLLLNLISK